MHGSIVMIKDREDERSKVNSMLIHNKLIKSFVYFIHIPRTGGRFINSIFLNDKNYITSFKNYDSFYKNRVIPHLTYPHYLDLDKFFINYNNLDGFNIKSIEHFTVVRNPFCKFKSSIKAFLTCEKDLSNIIDLSKNELQFFINEINSNTNDNWFISQSSFISSQTKIWKYENGIGVDFVKWIKKEFNFDIKNTNAGYLKKCYDSTNLDLDSLEKIRPIIKEIYKEDFIKFGYE
jgi:hypothetical protein